MTPKMHVDSRRRFLALLAGSPLLAALDLPTEWVTAALAQEHDADLIKTVADVLDVFDFEAVAKKKLPPAHFAYMSAVEDEATYRANRDGFMKYQLRVRRLVDTSKTDSSVTVFGTKWERPLLLCPVGGERAFHQEGEVAVARAAKAKNNLQALSTVASASIEDVAAARGGPVWFQLYQDRDWNRTRGMIKRAEAAGSPVLAFTVDTMGGRKMEVMEIGKRRDTRNCLACHTGDAGKDQDRKPMRAGTKPLGPPMLDEGSPTWDYVKRLKDATSMKVVIKGIVTREDAELAMTHGADGVWVSNHGGRAENSIRSSIECVSEVAAGVAGRGPVIADSGFRRGTDMFKALALGATMVGVGRPYLWALAAFGQEGVEAVIDMLGKELQMVMRQAGTPSIAKITKSYVVDHSDRL